MLLVVAFPNTQNIVGETWTATGKPFVIHVATSSCRVCAIIAWTCVNVCQIVKNLDWTDAISNTFKMGTIEVKGLLAVDQDRSFLLAKVMVAHWGISFFNYNTTVIMCAGTCRKYRCLLFGQQVCTWVPVDVAFWQCRSLQADNHGLGTVEVYNGYSTL